MISVQIRLVPRLEPHQIISQDLLSRMYDAQIKRRRVVERDTEVPPDVGQGGDVAEHVEQLGGIVERGRVGRAGDGAIVFVDDVAVVERGDERGGFLGVSSYSDLFCFSRVDG